MKLSIGALCVLASVAYGSAWGQAVPGGGTPAPVIGGGAPRIEDTRGSAQGADSLYDRTRTPARAMGNRMRRSFEKPDTPPPSDVRIQGEGVKVPNCVRESREGEGCK